MKVLQIKKGNLLDAPEKMILHGCNSRGVMGSGVAKTIKEKWPQVYAQYYTYCKKYTDDYGDHVPVGTVIFTDLDPREGYANTRFVANCITQESYGADGRKYASYEGLVTCLMRVRKMCEIWSIDAVALPPIGCGLGGLDRSVVYPLVQEIFGEHDILATVYDL